MPSTYGHDAFLLEIEEQEMLVKGLSCACGKGGKMTTKLTAYEQQEHLIIADLVHEQATVLDLGCGNGELLELLRERKDINGQGIEIDDEAILPLRPEGADGVSQ